MVEKKSEITGIALFSGIENTLLMQPAKIFKLKFEEIEFEFGKGAFVAENSCSHWLNKSKVITLVEHLLACTHFSKPFKVELSHNEIPLLDGSAKPFWDWILQQNMAKKPELYSCDLCEEWTWNGGYFKVEPSEKFEINYKISKGEFYQEALWSSDDSPQIILESRTFIYESFLKEKMANKLFKGARTGMSIVLNENASPLEGEFRNSKELVRHKILDLLGDLALVRPSLPKLKITCLNGNHKENHKLAERILLNVTTR